jgi:hypothetical protein
MGRTYTPSAILIVHPLGCTSNYSSTYYPALVVLTYPDGSA